MPELTVASFNLHWGVDRRGRPFDTAAVCRALDADVLVLQELWRPGGEPCWLDELAREQRAELHEAVLAPDSVPGRPRAIRPRPGRLGTWGVAVSSRLPVRRHFTFDMGRPFGDVVPHRLAVCVEVDVDGAQLIVAGVHASHRLWGSPRQMHRLDDRLAREAVASVIVGDLNMWGAVLQRVMPARRRAVRGATWPAHRPHSQIDHVWSSAGVDLVAADVLGDVGSDHRPVRARLRVGDSYPL